MTTRQRPGINADPAEMRSGEEAKERPLQPRYPCRFTRSLFRAFSAPDASRCIDAETHACVGDCVRSSATEDRLPWRPFRHGLDIGNRTQQMRQTKPMVIWVKNADYRGGLRGSCSFTGKGANEANGNLDKICRLSGSDLESPLVRTKRANEANGNLDKICCLYGIDGLQRGDRLFLAHANRANEAIVKMDRICELRGISNGTGARISTHAPAGVPPTDGLSRRTSFHRVSKHDGSRVGSQAARWSNEPRPGGLLPDREPRYGTNPMPENPYVTNLLESICGESSPRVPFIHSPTTDHWPLTAGPMKILALSRRAFGPFTDVTLDFSGGREGLHLVYGPHEAGKSSALRAATGVVRFLCAVARRLPAQRREDAGGDEAARRRGPQAGVGAPQGDEEDAFRRRWLFADARLGAGEGLERDDRGRDQPPLRARSRRVGRRGQVDPRGVGRAGAVALAGGGQSEGLDGGSARAGSGSGIAVRAEWSETADQQGPGRAEGGQGRGCRPPGRRRGGRHPRPEPRDRPASSPLPSGRPARSRPSHRTGRSP